MYNDDNAVCGNVSRKSKLDLVAEKLHFTDDKMVELGKTVTGLRNKANRFDSIIDKLEDISDKYATAAELLNRDVEVGDIDGVEQLEAQIEAIEGVLPKEILELEKVLGLTKTAKKMTKEEARKVLGL